MEQKEINLQELSYEQLDQLAVSLSVQIAQIELSKHSLLVSIDQVLAQMEKIKPTATQTTNTSV